MAFDQLRRHHGTAQLKLVYSRKTGGGKPALLFLPRPSPCGALFACLLSSSRTLTRQSSAMTKVRLNYDGWLSLPTAVRQKLGLTTGDQLELELSDGNIVLRPVRSGTTLTKPPPRRWRWRSRRSRHPASCGSRGPDRQARSGSPAQDPAAGSAADAQGPRRQA